MSGIFIGDIKVTDMRITPQAQTATQMRSLLFAKVKHSKSFITCMYMLKCSNEGSIASLWPFARKFETIGISE